MEIEDKNHWSPPLIQQGLLPLTLHKNVGTTTIRNMEFANFVGFVFSLFLKIAFIIFNFVLDTEISFVYSIIYIFKSVS